MDKSLKEKYKVAQDRKVQLSQDYTKVKKLPLKEKELEQIEKDFFKFSMKYRRNLLSIYNDICKKELTTIQNKDMREKLSLLKYGILEQLNSFEVSKLFKYDVFFKNFCKEIRLTPKEIEICRAIRYDDLNEKQLRETFFCSRSTLTNQLYSIKQKLSEFYNHEIETKSIICSYLPQMELNEEGVFKDGYKTIRKFLQDIL